MKKQQLRNLSLKKSTISKINELQSVTGGGTMSTEPGCVDGSDSAVILCMEDFTLGCSPSFLRQCPITKDTDPQYCW